MPVLQTCVAGDPWYQTQIMIVNADVNPKRPRQIINIPIDLNDMTREDFARESIRAHVRLHPHVNGADLFLRDLSHHVDGFNDTKLKGELSNRRNFARINVPL